MATYKHNKANVDKWNSEDPLIAPDKEGPLSRWKTKRAIKKADKEEYQGRGKYDITTTTQEGKTSESTPGTNVVYQKGGAITSHEFEFPGPGSTSLSKQIRKADPSEKAIKYIKDNISESGSKNKGTSKSVTNVISKKKWGEDYKPIVKFELDTRTQLQSVGEGEKSSISMTKYNRKGKEKSVKTKKVGEIGYESLLHKRGEKLEKARKKDLHPKDKLRERTKEKQKQLDMIKKGGAARNPITL